MTEREIERLNQRLARENRGGDREAEIERQRDRERDGQRQSMKALKIDKHSNGQRKRQIVASDQGIRAFINPVIVPALLSLFTHALSSPCTVQFQALDPSVPSV